MREHTPLDGAGEADRQVTVVRKGDTIAAFSRLDIGRSSSFPPELIERQIARLDNVRKSAAGPPADGPAPGAPGRPLAAARR
ncbi:hypothetical protein ACGFXC_27440 [Streptomyces sp. NPDC048507]|uniref:hypothetical protein n=1 Tax=Streptomyces sp. NPDC048507 TaxID=3365560 RepID=UPI00370FAB7D